MHYQCFQGCGVFFLSRHCWVFGSPRGKVHWQKSFYAGLHACARIRCCKVSHLQTRHVRLLFTGESTIEACASALLLASCYARRKQRLQRERALRPVAKGPTRALREPWRDAGTGRFYVLLFEGAPQEEVEPIELSATGGVSWRFVAGTQPGAVLPAAVERSLAVPVRERGCEKLLDASALPLDPSKLDLSAYSGLVIILQTDDDGELFPVGFGLRMSRTRLLTAYHMHGGKDLHVADAADYDRHLQQCVTTKAPLDRSHSIALDAQRSQTVQHWLRCCTLGHARSGLCSHWRQRVQGGRRLQSQRRSFCRRIRFATTGVLEKLGSAHRESHGDHSVHCDSRSVFPHRQHGSWLVRNSSVPHGRRTASHDCNAHSCQPTGSQLQCFPC